MRGFAATLMLIAVAAALQPAAPAMAVEITGAGATFPYPIYAKWATRTRLNRVSR